MRLFIILTITILGLCFSDMNAQELKLPSFEEALSVPTVSNPVISPDGQHILYTVRKYDWENNRRDSEIWLSKDRGEPFQLTRTQKGSSSSAQWSPDGNWISFTADRGNGRQIYIMNVNGGEAFQVSNIKNNLGEYAWSPDSKQIAFTSTPKVPKQDKKRKDQFGAYAVDDEEFKLASVHLIDFNPDYRHPSELPCFEEIDSLKKVNCLQWEESTPLIDSVDYTIRSIEWSPDGKYIAFTKTPNPLITSLFDSDIGIVDVASKEVEVIVENKSADNFEAWSPDSKSILYQSAVDNRSSLFYTNDRIFIKLISGGVSKEIAKDFDEDISIVDWNPTGIYFTGFHKTVRNLYRIDPSTGTITILDGLPEIVAGTSFSKNGQTFACQARNGNQIYEIFTGSSKGGRLQKLTNENDMVKMWKTSDSEVISWPSEDGTIIEGILHKPKDFEPGKKYPLFVIIHGGPTGISLRSPLPGGVYPILQWLDKGALVLQPNYRGSAGYGGAFRALNVRNLGVGDAWDVLSGVDYLVNKGMVDPDKMGCMGWSQGGYISAFITTTSDKFAAVSVGAGISNWMTYYVNTDIHPFTRQYLKATPWEDQEIYEKTSPMTYINDAKTPTLIQHGEFDRRVPIPNAYELLQGLRDQGVDSKLIVYKGFGHGISKPKERLAAIWHNWQWFNKYIWQEDVKLPFEEN